MEGLLIHTLHYIQYVDLTVRTITVEEKISERVRLSYAKSYFSTANPMPKWDEKPLLLINPIC